MKYLLFIFASLIASALSAGELTVAKHPDWRPASAAQVAALANQPNVKVLDFSLGASGGGAFLLRSEVPSDVHPEHVAQTVAGYLQSIEANGHTVVSRQPARIGSLPGECVVSKNQANGTQLGTVGYLVFAKRQIYTVAVFGPGETTETSPLVRGYLARIRVPADVVPGSIDPATAHERGRRLGILIGRNTGWLLIGAFIFIGVMVYRDRKRRERTASASGAPEGQSDETATEKPGALLLTASTLLVVINMALGFGRAPGNISYSLGAAMAPLFFAVVVALLFSLSKRFRSPRAKTTVVLLTSLVLLLAALGNPR